MCSFTQVCYIEQDGVPESRRGLIAFVTKTFQPASEVALGSWRLRLGTNCHYDTTFSAPGNLGTKRKETWSVILITREIDLVTSYDQNSIIQGVDRSCAFLAAVSHISVRSSQNEPLFRKEYDTGLLQCHSSQSST